MAATIDYQHILEHLVPTKFRVPGAATAILKDGELVAKHAWGYANLATREPVTPNTIFPICSISKQMVCIVLTELITERGPQFGDAVLKAVLDMLPSSIASDHDFTLERLVGMQSGLRDYWGLSVLWGATPQDRFSIYQDALPALQRLGGCHFAPGTQMSYCNTNFMVVGLAIEKVTGESLSSLLQARVFATGMKTAALRPDTSRIPPPIVGYEGSEETGYIPYANRIEWAGDAGVQASLEDMISYEQYIDRSMRHKDSAYYKNSEEPKYIDGGPAYYGHGLVFMEVQGAKVIGHSGGLAGFRLRRAYVPEHRLSVIVLLNSHTDTKPVVEHILQNILPAPSTEQLQPMIIKPTEPKIDVKWTGAYLDDDANLAVVVKQDKPGELTVNYDGHDDKLPITTETDAGSKEMQLHFEDTTLSITRSFENRTFTARPLASTPSADAARFTGKYYSEETDSTFHVSGSGSMLYGAFNGYLGSGPIHVMRWLGEDVWWLACFRSLDAPAPGNWTVVFNKEEGGEGIVGVTIGCWLARNVKYKKVEG